MFVNGLSTKGCTHQVPPLANKTIRCSGRAPLARPSMVSSLSGPPSAKGGSLLNSTEGLAASPDDRQALIRIQMRIRTAPFDLDFARLFRSFSIRPEEAFTREFLKISDIDRSCVN